MATGALLAASIGQNLYSSISGARKEKRMRRQKSKFFDNELSPLLDEATKDVDVDFSTIYDAEMDLPLANLQSGMRSLSRNRDASFGRSGFKASSFIDNDYQNDAKLMQSGFDNQQFQTQRGMIDLQSQLESIVSDNKIRAKELEYQFKYG
jgi:hypothetical protein